MKINNVADLMVETLQAAGVRRIYGLVGDSLNGITEAIRRSGAIDWVHVRHEEVAAFAAGADAQVSGGLAVCAGSCGPGNLHLINGLYDCQRTRTPVLAIAAPLGRDRLQLLPGDPSRGAVPRVQRVLRAGVLAGSAPLRAGDRHPRRRRPAGRRGGGDPR